MTRLRRDGAAGRHADDAGSGVKVILAVAVVLLLAAGLLVLRPWSSAAKPAAAHSPATHAASTKPTTSAGPKATSAPTGSPSAPGAVNASGLLAQPSGTGVAAPKLPVTYHPGVPVQVAISRLGISSSLQSLGLLPDGSLQPPTQYGVAGWYARGIRPGAVGPALIAGHVDSYQGPAVFYRLRDVKVGDDITVRDNLGITRHFTVATVQSFAKAQFPSAAVYGPTALPVLRLVTCTGDFDVSKRSYVDNLVVSANLTS